MDTATLVEKQIESGRRLIERLVNTSFEVTAAFWIKISETGSSSGYSSSGNIAVLGPYSTSGNVALVISGQARWYLYIASPKVEESLAKAYQVVFATLQSMPDLSISMSQLKLIGANDPTAQQIVAIESRFPDPEGIQLSSIPLHGLSAEEGFVYPSRKSVPATLRWMMDPKPDGAQNGAYPNARAAIDAARAVLPNAVVLVQWGDSPPTTISEAWIWRSKEEADSGSLHAAKVVSAGGPIM